MGTKSVDTVLVKVMRNSYVRVNDTSLAHSSHVDPPLKPRFNCSPIEAIETPFVGHTYSQPLITSPESSP
jgi:hypothetical protein